MNNLEILSELTKTIDSKKTASAKQSYVASLFEKGQDAILKKVIEEAGETLMASKDQDRQHVIKEVADLLFHSMVLLSYHNLNIDDVLAELKLRQNTSGLVEKASRNINK